MRTRLLLFAAAALALSGCVIHDHNNVPPPGVPGNVNITWSFSDGSACGTNGVDHVRITIPGESLQNGGVYPCLVAGTAGIQLQDFAAGSYSYSISAEDGAGRPLYGGSGAFTVNGDVTVGALLQPLTAPGNVNFTWTFSDGNTCSQLAAFVDHIRIAIPGESLQSGGIYPCQLAGAQGIQLQDFAPGTYSFSVTAESANGTVLYGTSGNFTVFNGDVSVPVVLSPVNNAQPGNLLVYWSFPSGMTCASSGADHVVINIPGESLANGGVYPCQTNGVQGISLNNFAPRGYTVNVTAVDVNNNPLYAGSSNVSVNGDTQVSVALTATTNATATLQLRWSFLDANQTPLTCVQAGVTNVQVTLGSAQTQTVACNNGFDGYNVPSLAAGVYQVVLTALDASGSPQYTYNQNIAVSAPTTVANVQLAPLSGSWDLAYNFSNAATCTIAGVTQVSVSVKDASGNEISGIAAGTRYNCQDTPNNVFHWDSFQGGNVTIQMYGYASNGSVIRGATRSTTVTAGASNSTTVTLDTCGTANSGC